ncbi:histidinol-phosphate transaminase [Isachenkonia alkalipeptolytica]|uniref:Histidinol-phosphate aminotransferase n=1 Tax=Isachenkonia alkalipeptolytica TaxID=2565777 RepID=A0AA43XLW7_9CLOT|nr:histidinol-phosphate transaminase [Isachenkonia alkalipeptolytica]NBG89047.1 histidinol-phosphate transaminase [Isachenkonia alkalipeptolytica]
MTIEFRPQIKDLQAYKPGKPMENVKREYGLDRVIKLASNENPLGCSEKSKQAIQDALSHLNIYPDGNTTDLKETIAEKFNIKTTQILPSSGSDEMVDQISKTFIQEGDEVIMADITFPRYISTCKMMGGVPVVVPLKNHAYDLEGMKEKITDKTRLIWLCNPNNPTGTMFTKDVLDDFLQSVPQDIVVVYDEAYREYVTREDYPKNALEYLPKYPNLIIMRTFSKAYGLAALRVGYTLASEEIIDHINRIRGPFNVNTLAQVGAIAALKDDEFLQRSYDVNEEGKRYLYKIFQELNLEFAPSETNHIFVDVKKDAQEIFVELQKRGVIIRPIYGNFIRVSIGTMEENVTFVEKLREVL